MNSFGRKAYPDGIILEEVNKIVLHFSHVIVGNERPLMGVLDPKAIIIALTMSA